MKENEGEEGYSTSAGIGGKSTMRDCSRRLPSLCAALNPETDLVGLRIPDAPLINALTAALGQPLALTSANTSGQPSSLHVREFRALWPQLDLLYDGGALESGRAGSTVVDLSQAPEYRILRQGRFALVRIV